MSSISLNITFIANFPDKLSDHIALNLDVLMLYPTIIVDSIFYGNVRNCFNNSDSYSIGEVHTRMSTPVNWYDAEHTIVIVTITRESTWDEYHQVIDWIVTEVKQVNHRVDIIFHDNVGMPKGNPLPHIRLGAQKIIDLPNPGHTFVAGSQGHSYSFVQMVMLSLAKAYLGTELLSHNGKHLLFEPSLEAALNYIYKDRAESENKS